MELNLTGNEHFQPVQWKQLYNFRQADSISRKLRLIDERHLLFDSIELFVFSGTIMSRDLELSKLVCHLYNSRCLFNGSKLDWTKKRWKMSRKIVQKTVLVDVHLRYSIEGRLDLIWTNDWNSWQKEKSFELDNHQLISWVLNLTICFVNAKFR